MSVPRFWRKQSSRYNLIGTQCSKCKSLFFPPREVCRKCKSTKLVPHKFNGEGKIVSYTVIRVPPIGFELLTPYVIAIVQLEEGPKLTAQIADCEPAKVSIGDKVQMAFRRISEDGKTGAIYYGYKFKCVHPHLKEVQKA